MFFASQTSQIKTHFRKDRQRTQWSHVIKWDFQKEFFYLFFSSIFSNLGSQKKEGNAFFTQPGVNCLSHSILPRFQFYISNCLQSPLHLDITNKLGMFKTERSTFTALKYLAFISPSLVVVPWFSSSKLPWPLLWLEFTLLPVQGQSMLLHPSQPGHHTSWLFWLVPMWGTWPKLGQSE